MFPIWISMQYFGVNINYVNINSRFWHNMKRRCLDTLWVLPTVLWTSVSGVTCMGAIPSLGVTPRSVNINSSLVNINSIGYAKILFWALPTVVWTPVTSISSLDMILSPVLPPRGTVNIKYRSCKHQFKIFIYWYTIGWMGYYR